MGQGLVADCLGRGRVMRARKIAKRLLQYGAVSGGVVGFLFLLGGTSLPQVFCPDVAVQRKVRPVLWVLSLLVPLTAIVQVGGGILQGAQDFDFQAQLMGGCVLVSGGLLHLTTRAVPGAGLLPVWLSLLVFQALRVLGFAYRFYRDPKAPLADKQSIPPTSLLPSFVQRWWAYVVSFWDTVEDETYMDGMVNRARLLLPGSTGPKTPEVTPADVD